jgi:cyclopropane fatty-acyl-phospholipid synthase-like methyltransferase
MIRRLFFELRYLLGLAPWDTGISPPELMRFIESNPSGRALDIGCGTGTNAITLAEHGWQVTGLDFSGQAIARSRRKARSKSLQIEFIQGDVNALNDLRGTFDLCLDIGCYHSLPLVTQAAYADQLARLTTAGGTILMYSFLHSDDEDYPSWPSEERLEQQFRERFEIISVEHGSDHHRASAWFSMRRKA